MKNSYKLVVVMVEIKCVDSGQKDIVNNNFSATKKCKNEDTVL